MSRPSLPSVRVRLLLLVLAAIVPVLGLMLYRNVELRRMVVADVRAEALRLARISASDQEEAIRNTRQFLFILAQLPEVRTGEAATCSAFFGQLLGQYPQYALLGVARADGEVVCGAPGAAGQVDLAGQAYFQRVLQTGNFAISDYRSDPVSGKATLDFGYPVLDETGQLGAVVFASLDLIWLNQVAAEVQLPRGSTFTVIDRNGTILVRYPDPGVWVGRSVPEAPVVERILSQKGEGTTEANGVDGVPRLFAFTLLSGAPGSGEVYVSLGIPTDVAFADANRVLARNLAGLGLAAMLALAAAWVGGDLFILRWVKVLVETTKRLSAGDLSVRTGLPYGRGELSQLAQAFDDMAASLERRVAERDRAEDALRSAFQLLEQRVAERTRELSALYDVTKVASESLNMETILERSLNRVLAAMGSEVGAVHLVDESEGVLRLAAGHGLPSEYRVQTGTMALGEGLTSWVLEHGEPLVLPNIAAGPRPLLALPARDSQAYVAVPIRAKEKILGVLSVVGEMGRQYKSEEVSLLDSIADQVGVALDNARLYRQAEQLAVIKERSRMARELHDSVTQSLYSLTLFAEAGRRLALAGDLNQVSTYLTRLGETARQALKEMRHLVYELRPLDLEQEGLVGALQQRLDAVEGRSGVQTRLLVEAAREVPALVEAQLYRIAQEALNNALKHAEATIVTVRLGQDGEQVVLEVMDDGRGFDPDVPSGRGGLGLTSMRERAERMGGTLAIRAAPGKGTTVLVTVPAASSAFQAVEPAIDPFAVG